uniref:UBX domain-containing protein n=1 Tax=Chrysotila carterae TaxID=13221 RepID=A0A7S4B3A1_CHRCT
MADLKAGIPPVEFRELDLRSGVPRPRPVDIMLVDLRPRPYPEEAAARAARADAPAPPPAATPFAGQGRTLADDAAPAANAAAASAAASGTEWPLAGQTQPEVDTSLPTTEVQLRLAGGGTRRFRLNLTNSILDLRVLVEAELMETGAAFRPYQLLSGFPPRPLPADDTTLEQANLTNAAVSQRWL